MAKIRLDQLTKQFGDVVAVDDVTLEVADREFLTLLGPSGCGKTTTLNIIAGLETPTSGTVWFDEDEVTHVPPEQRDIAMVFQTYALYPHMKVFDNIAFGLRMRNVPKSDVEKRVLLAARTMDIEHLIQRKPRELSGGQRQRVALARAIVRDPRVFLLDEPLSNLDAQLRVIMRTELKRLHAELEKTFVYVTHDQAESLIMSDRIVVMKAGGIQQVGTPDEIYNQPTNTFVATFVGSPPINLLEGKLKRINESTGQVTGAGFTCEMNPLLMKRLSHSATTSVRLGIRPEDIEVGTVRTPTAQATVAVREPMGSDLYLTLDIEGRSIKARTRPDVRIDRGEVVPIYFDSNKLHLFDGETGRTVLEG